MEKIVDRLEREKWEVRTLGEIAREIYRGNGVTKAQLDSGNHPAIKCGDVNSGLPVKFERCISFVDVSLIKNPKFFENGDILIGALAHNIGAIGRAIVYMGHEKCVAGNDVVVVRTDENSKFLVYLLSSKYCRKQIEKRAQAGTVVHFHMKEIMQLKIPLPPRHIQDLIVEQLDQMNESLGELERSVELLGENRNRQYEYYRDRFTRGK